MAEETQPEKEKILGTKILKALKQKIADWISTRQPILVSGTNIKTVEDETLLGSGNLSIPLKTINNTSLKGAGNIALQTPLTSGTTIKTINNQTLLGSGNINIDSAKLYTDYGIAQDGSPTQKLFTDKLRGQKVEIGDASSAVTNGSVAVGSTAVATGDSSVAIGRDATADQMYGVSVGPRTEAETAGAVALGYNITSGTGVGSIAIGYGSRGSTLPPSTEEETSTDSTIAIGFNAAAADQAAITIGNESEARFQCLAIGNNLTKARGRRNIAIGAQAEATAESGEDSDGAIAMGILSKTTGTHGIAIGYGAKASERNTVSMSLNAEATKEGAVAIGTNATAGNQFSVALGHSSVTSADNTISVGTSTNNRRIMNVATGVADTDAVNKKQLEDAIASAGSGSGSGSGNLTYYYSGNGNYNQSLTTSGFTLGRLGETEIPAGTYWVSMALRTSSNASSFSNIQINALYGSSETVLNHSVIASSGSGFPADYIYQGVVTFNSSTSVYIGYRANYAALPVASYSVFALKLA